jgi:hypothetical protein
VVTAAAGLGDAPPARRAADAAKMLEEAGRPNAILRRYRRNPPRLRNADGSWKTPQVEEALAGDFDLIVPV